MNISFDLISRRNFLYTMSAATVVGSDRKTLYVTAGPHLLSGRSVIAGNAG